MCTESISKATWFILFWVNGGTILERVKSPATEAVRKTVVSCLMYHWRLYDRLMYLLPWYVIKMDYNYLITHRKKVVIHLEQSEGEWLKTDFCSKIYFHDEISPFENTKHGGMPWCLHFYCNVDENVSKLDNDVCFHVFKFRFGSPLVTNNYVKDTHINCHSVKHAWINYLKHTPINYVKHTPTNYVKHAPVNLWYLRPNQLWEQTPIFTE